MTLTELRYILAVAKEGHFGRAAKSCFVSQPTLSLGIKKLEDELGVTLFERGSRDINVTPVGHKILVQTERALREINAIKEVAKLNKDPMSTPIRIGAIYTVGPYLYPSMLPILRRNHPQLPLLIEENYTSNLTTRLQNGDIDAALIALPFEEPGIETCVLYEEPFVVLLPCSHELTSQEFVNIDDVARETVLLLGPQHCIRDQILEICPECIHSIADNMDLQTTLEGGSLETIRHMVAGGVGVTILPATAACAEKYKQRLVSIRRFRDIKPSRRVALAWRKGFSRMPAIRSLINSIIMCDLRGVKMIPHANAVDNRQHSDMVLS